MKTRLALPFLLAALALNACAPSNRSNSQPSKEELKANTEVHTDDRGEVPTVTVSIDDGRDFADPSETQKTNVPFAQDNDSVEIPGSTVKPKKAPTPIAPKPGKPTTESATDAVIENETNNDSSDVVASEEEQDQAAASTAGDEFEDESGADAVKSQVANQAEKENTGEDEDVAADDGTEPGAVNSFEDGDASTEDERGDKDADWESQAARKGGTKKAATRKPAPKKTAARRAGKPAPRGAARGKSSTKSSKGKVAPRKTVRRAAPALDRSRITIGSIASTSSAPKQNESAKFAPASITKLVTTGMALERLGHDFAFRNKIAWRLAQGSSTTATNLTWLGEGDPTVGHPKFDVTPMSTLKKFAQSLKDKGIKSVQGPIVLRTADPRMNKWFVAEGVPAWEPFVCYGAPPQAFNIFANCSQGLNGKAPAIRDTQTRAKQAFVAALKSVGITVNESVRPAAALAVTSVMFRSAAMTKLLYWMNKRSDNLIAESLFKAVAKTMPGQNLQANGQAFYKNRIATWLTEIGVPSFIGELNFLDGSGLTANNVVTPRGFVQMLKHYIPKKYFGDIWQSLPIAGVDGTLKNRLKSNVVMGKVRAKTGTLTGYYQLAGYIPRLNADNKTVKELVPFVILTKAPGSKEWGRAARAYQDEVLINLTRKVNGK